MATSGSTIEQQFARFRATRSTDALGAVFDEIAPRLLLVAVHLVGERTEAEDVVQQTFVEIIDKADQYDASRPLEPWLVGVLANRAKVAIRSRARRRTREGGSHDGDVESIAPGPMQLAEAQEIAQRVHAEIAGLPPTYRQVLILHLLHGLGGAQIAYALGRPPATVRTQLKRGIEMLRSALPVALALPVTLLATEGHGMAAMRSFVLDHARTAAASATAGVAMTASVAVGASFAMKKILAVVVVAVLGLGVWWTQQPNGDASPAPVRNEPTRTVDDASLDPNTAPKPSQSTPNRTGVEIAPSNSTPHCIVHGRCVDARTSLPVANATLTLYGAETMTGAMSAGSGRHVLLSQQARCQSDGEGHFRFGIEHPGRDDWNLHVRANGCVHGSLEFRVAADETRDLGDLKLTRGAQVRLTTVDTDGNPVAGVAIRVEPRWASLDGAMISTAMVAQSDARGVVELHRGAPVPPGSWPIELHSDWRPLETEHIVVPFDREHVDQTIVVVRPSVAERIRGRVVDARGTPIAGATIRVLAGNGRYVATEGLSSRDGSFEVARAADDGDTASLAVSGPDEAWIAHRTEPIRWGAETTKVVLERTRSLEVLVTNAKTGQPVEGFGLAHKWSADPIASVRGVPSVEQCGVHDGGRVELRGFGSEGRLFVVVIPQSKELCMSDIHTVELDTASLGPLQIAVWPASEFDVRCTVAGRGAAVGSTIEVVELPPKVRLKPGTSVMPRNGVVWNISNRNGAWPVAFTWDKQDTDGDGGATLRVRSDVRRVGLRITGESHAAQVVFPLEKPRDGELLEIQLPAAATIRGSVGPAGFRDAFLRTPDSDVDTRRNVLRLGLRRPGDTSASYPSDGSGIVIGDDDTFELKGVPVGTWEIVAIWLRPEQQRRQTIVTLDPPLARVDVEAGESVEVDLDLGPHRPSKLAGKTTIDGVPIRSAVVTLSRRRMSNGKQRIDRGLGGARTDVNGSFVIGGLGAGDYLVEAFCVDERGVGRRLYAHDWVSLRGGVEHEQLFELANRDCRIRLFDANGQAISTRPVTIYDDALARTWTLRTDDDGRVLAENAVPSSRLRVVLHAPEAILDPGDDWSKTLARRGTELGRFEVPIGSGMFEAELHAQR